MNSNPKPTKVTATASSTADGLTTIATISVSISAASSPTTNRSQNASSSRLFNRNKDRQFTPYQKPAIGFASRKFKTRIPDSSELNSKINTYANKLIEELTGQQEVLEEKINKEDIIIEISKLEQNLETESNDSSSRSRLSIKQALPATQVITPIPTEPSPPLSFVNPVKFLEDIHEASENIENNNKENRIINVNGEENEGNKVVLVDVNKVVVCELVEKADEMNIEDK
ncbi:6957_t:CDS:1 [Diversispora eburnea]|uniref:6957_t:CDS:1 n=1 Tax=Diversispora eburnea TaxID=1213867 RepID=A0A9N8V832_9GLOM|nr:6957_t:CDS:1 [Diversispora eburnea]